MNNTGLSCRAAIALLTRLEMSGRSPVKLLHSSKGFIFELERDIQKPSRINLSFNFIPSLEQQLHHFYTLLYLASRAFLNLTRKKGLCENHVSSWLSIIDSFKPSLNHTLHAKLIFIPKARFWSLPCQYAIWCVHCLNWLDRSD